MRVRARHVHAFETFFDNVVGLIFNFCAVLFIYNGMFGHNIQINENVVGGAIMFFVAWGRKYTIRRWANSLIRNLYARYELQEQAGEK